MEATKQNESERDLILRYLDVHEVDDFVIGRLRLENTAPEILIGIIKGNIKSSEGQLANAIYVLGALQQLAAIEPLLSLVDRGPPSLQLHALAALGRIGPNEKAQVMLKKLAGDKQAVPAKIAFALNALTASDDSTLRTYFRENPPAHADDVGVKKALIEIVGLEDRPLNDLASVAKRDPRAEHSGTDHIYCTSTSMANGSKLDSN